LVLGKWIGFVLMISLYTLLVEGGTIAITWAESHYLLAHCWTALGLIWLQATLLMTVTLAASTYFSALTSGTISIGLYGLAFVGGWIETIGALQHVKLCVDLGVLASLIMPSDALWRRAAAILKPPLLGAIGATPFNAAVTPSVAMIIYAALYTLAALLLAQLLFTRRDL
jgi:ABC-type transport system involved in multi-copper enzyme maturation permease subunit